MDTVRSADDLCFDLGGVDNFTPEEELLFSYFRGGVDKGFSEFLPLDNVCWENVEDGGPYTLWVMPKDLAGNIGSGGRVIW